MSCLQNIYFCTKITDGFLLTRGDVPVIHAYFNRQLYIDEIQEFIKQPQLLPEVTKHTVTYKYCDINTFSANDVLRRFLLVNVAVEVLKNGMVFPCGLIKLNGFFLTNSFIFKNCLKVTKIAFLYSDCGQTQKFSYLILSRKWLMRWKKTTRL